MTLMKRYVVMHDYGTEGWVIVAQGDTIVEAVRGREDSIQSGSGGTTEIFEYLPVMHAYARAQDECDATGRNQ